MQSAECSDSEYTPFIDRRKNIQKWFIEYENVVRQNALWAVARKIEKCPLIWRTKNIIQ